MNTPHPRTWKAALGAAAVLAALGLPECSRNPRAAEDENASGAEAVAEVTVVQVRAEEISAVVSVSGTIAAPPNLDARVSAQVPGRVGKMLVAEGDRVSRGETLAKIEEGPFQDQLRQAEAAVEQARATLENARLNRERNDNLFQRGIAARKDVEDARTQQSVSEAALRQAEAARELARLQLARTEVRSPLAGTVVKRFLSVGEQVDGTAAQPIVEVADLAQVELLGNAPAVYLGKIRGGQSLPIVTEAFPGKNFTGRVVAISPAVDPSTSLGLVRIQIANPAGLLRWGMFLMAQIPIETHPHALVIPRQAVYRDEKGQAQVYRVKGSSAEAVAVKLGIEAADRVELLEGVAAGDTLILAGGYGLGAQSKIKVKP